MASSTRSTRCTTVAGDACAAADFEQPGQNDIQPPVPGLIQAPISRRLPKGLEDGGNGGDFSGLGKPPLASSSSDLCIVRVQPRHTDLIVAALRVRRTEQQSIKLHAPPSRASH